VSPNPSPSPSPSPRPITEASTVGFPRWSSRHKLWFLVAVLVPFLASGPVTTIPRHDLGVAEATFVSLLAVAIGGLHLRHSLAATRGERPAGAWWTFLALAALVYVPVLAFGYDWSHMHIFVVASGAMVLPRLLAGLAVAGPIIGQPVVVVFDGLSENAEGGLIAAVTGYHFALLAMSAAALYGSVWLVRVLDDLYAARTELAELAVGRERLRVSRDLHDLLGQSLSAVSLKGDLALKLLASDTAAARAEIESLTGVARSALRDVRAVAHDEHGVSLEAELSAAAVLLEAAGIATHIDVDLADLPAPVESVLAWAVREGATNTLRHSEATTWRVTAGRSDGRVRLEIVNDGAASMVSSDGTGLAGLADRARAVSGSSSAGPLDGDRFRLVVEIPETAEVAP
jgi:two-component system sensor histidine kinase DesK